MGALPGVVNAFGQQPRRHSGDWVVVRHALAQDTQLLIRPQSTLAMDTAMTGQDRRHTALTHQPTTI